MANEKKGVVDITTGVEVADVNANGVLDLTSTEVTQLANIDTTTISTTQWGYLGLMDQDVTTASNVEFDELTITGVEIVDVDPIVTIRSSNANGDTAIAFLESTAGSNDDGGRIIYDGGSNVFLFQTLASGVATNHISLFRGTNQTRILTPLMIGTNATPINAVDIEGNVAIGSNYSGSSSAPTDGLIVEGDVGIGTPPPSHKLEVNGDVLFADNLTIGVGAAGIDYQITFDGENSDGVIKYLEDEAQFEFDQQVNINIPTGSAQLQLISKNTDVSTIHFGDTDDPDIGRILYDHSSNSFTCTVNTTDIVTITDSALRVINDGSNAQIVVGDDTGSNFGYLFWDSANDYLRLEEDGTNGIKLNGNNVSIGNIFPSKPLIVGSGTTELLEVDANTLTTHIGRICNVTTVNAATYDLLITDHIVHVTYTSTGAVTSLTLPSAQTTSGRIIHIKDAGGNAGTNNITIDTEGAETIDGQATLVISVNYNYVTLYSDGSNWFVI